MLLVQGILLGLSAAASPGPFQAYLLARALQGGWRRTWSAAFAPLISDGPVVLTVLIILTRVPDWLVRGLRLAGGFFLLYLAWGVLSSLRAVPTAPAATAVAFTGQTIWQAALMNALSPGPWIFWSTVAGPAFLHGWERSALDGGLFLVGFYSAMSGVLLGLIGLFAVLGRTDARFVRVLNGISGLLLAGFGVYQIAAAF